VLLTFYHEADVTPDEGECMKENAGNMFSLSETPVEQPENRRGFETLKENVPDRYCFRVVILQKLFFKIAG
jgi:hypothetical protein